MAATQVQIAQELGIDVSSVNKILNHRIGPVFRKETIQRVFRKAKELNYKPSVASKGMLRSTLEGLFPMDVSSADLAIERGTSLVEVVRIKQMLYKIRSGGDKR